MPIRKINTPLHRLGSLTVRRSISIFAPVALVAGLLVLVPSFSSFADSETCGDLQMRLSNEFVEQDCTVELLTGGGYDGSAWVETIESTSVDTYIFVVSQRAATSRTRFRSTNLQQVFEDFGLGSEARMVGEHKSAMDGVRYVTIDNGNNCILFLKQANSRRGGYAFMAVGIGCQRDKIGAYREEDANRIISQIDFGAR